LLEQALGDLRWLAGQVEGPLSFDLADLRGYAYYTGVRFSLFAAASAEAVMTELVRGGRYDEVGAVFGRKRPAVGFSLDLKELVAAVSIPASQSAIRAPWGTEPGLRATVARLRAAGETVVCVLPGHEHEVDEFHCDRILVERGGQWVVQALKA
jgi:ATP phosphoribosyltransferase regulatory subunit